MTIEIWTDLTCTHCYTALNAFEKALVNFEHKEMIKVIKKSFELAPDFKTDSQKLLPEFLQEIHGLDKKQVDGMIDHVTNTAKSLGVEFNLHSAIPANTFNAHRLVHYAKDKNLQLKMEKRIYRAYFTEGKNIDNIPTLINLATEIGLNPQDVKNMLESSQYSDIVNQNKREAHDKQIKSVPTYIFNSNTIMSGAQGSSSYLEILKKEFEKWQAETNNNQTNVNAGESCNINGKC